MNRRILSGSNLVSCRLYEEPACPDLYFETAELTASQSIVRPFLGAQGNVCLAESSVEADPKVDSATPIPDDTENFSLHGQATYILQYKNKFNSPYQGEKACSAPVIRLKAIR